MEKRQLKREFNKVGLAIIIQQLIYEALALLIILSIKIINKQTESNFDISNGTLMIIMVIVGFIPFLVLRKKEFFSYDLKVKNKSINLKVVLIGIILVLGLNYISSFLTLILTAVLEGFGASTTASEAALNFTSGVPMIIYAILVAPLFEEFLYRGALLRYLERFGAKFAILISAIMFGLMHGNIIQIPSAILIGIVFGFIAKEYSIKLSILLHIINNAFAISVGFIKSKIILGVLALFIIGIITATVAIIIVYLCNYGNRVKMWFKNNKITKGYLLHYFSSITIIILIAYFIFTTIFLNKLF